MLKDNPIPMIPSVKSHTIANVSLTPTVLVITSRRWEVFNTSRPASGLSRAGDLVADKGSNAKSEIVMCWHLAGTEIRDIPHSAQIRSIPE